MTVVCPLCPQRFGVSLEDPDATLDDVRAHLVRAHGLHGDEALRALGRMGEPR